MEKQTAFRIHGADNVATALLELSPGSVRLLGDGDKDFVTAVQRIPAGHKIALKKIAPGEDIIKYGVVIGRATAEIGEGSWVHLHCMRSLYDERSAHLDPVTGVPEDMSYA